MSSLVVQQAAGALNGQPEQPRDDGPQSPIWWRDRLHKALRARRGQLAVYDNYYCGNQPLRFASTKFLEAFGGFFKAFADNWTQIVVDAVEERLNVEGFRLGGGAEAAEMPAGDREAWRIWQANELDAESQVLHTEALINGSAYTLVWRGVDDTPEITIEHPSQMIVAHVPGKRRERAAALKEWVDDWTGRLMSTLYLPDGLYKWESTDKVQGDPGELVNYDSVRWAEREVSSEAWPLPNPLKVVPVVPFHNRPRLLIEGVSEIREVIPLQDAVNKLVSDMLVASEYGAFRQRWVTGLDIPVDPATNKPVEPFEASVSRMWVGTDPETKFGEFSATELQNFVGAIELLVQHIATQTRTPPHYFFLRGSFPSGESIKSAETGLVAKAMRKMRHFGEAWEETIGLAFRVAGEPAPAESMETIWGDPESRSFGELIDGLMKEKAFGVPDEILWEKAGYSPTEIERIKRVRAEEPDAVVPPSPALA